MKNINFLLLALILTVVSCKKDDDNIEPIKIDYEILVNEKFQVELESNMTTGYSWQWTNRELIDIVDTTSWTYIISHPELIGSGGTEVWEFTGLKRGIDSVNLEYRRRSDPLSTIDIKTIAIKVN